jgi:serine/threonine protein kinase
MYCHVLPWEKTESLQTLLSHMNSPGKDPREHVPNIDKGTRAFLIKAIERDPNKRFQTAEEFREALKKLPKA